MHLVTSFTRDVAVMLAALYLVLLMFWTGLAKEPHEPKRDKYRHLALGLFINLILIPGIAVFMTRVLHTSGHVTRALLLLAAAPGGGVGPFMARVAGGDVALASEITLFLGKITVFTAPVVAKRFLGVHELKFEELPFLLSLLFLQLAPLYIGKAVRRWRPRSADRLELPIRRLVNAVVLTVLAFVLARGGVRALELVGDRGWLAVLLLALSSLGIGWLLGGPSARTRRAITMSTNSRQLPLGLVLAGIALPDHQLVQLAMFGVWAILAASDYLFALFIGRSHLVEASPTTPSGAVPS